MNTIIIYYTKYGSTKLISEKIANQLENVTLRDIKSEEPISIEDYDCVIIGSPLTAGKIRKEIKQFIQENSDKLMGKRLGLFVSGMLGSGEDEYFNANFSPELLEIAKAKSFLGGIYDPSKCGIATRAMFRLVALLDSYTDRIDENKIDNFVKQLTEQAK